MSADLPSSAPSTEPESSESVMLGRLATPSLSRPECPRHVTRKIDLLLLAIEALDLGASEAIVRSARELKLDSVVRGVSIYGNCGRPIPSGMHTSERP